MDATAFFENEPHHLRERRWLRRLAMSIVRDETVADDLVQDVFLQVLRCGALPDEPRKRLSYLAQAVRHVAARAIQKRRAEHRKREEAAKSALRPTVADANENAETERRLLDAVFRLPPEHRDAVLLRYYEDLPPRQVALRLAIPVERIYKLLADARAQLRGDLERKGLGPQWALVLTRWSAAKPATRVYVMSGASLALAVLMIAIAGGAFLFSGRGGRVHQPEGEAVAGALPAEHGGGTSGRVTNTSVESTDGDRARHALTTDSVEVAAASPAGMQDTGAAMTIAWTSPALEAHGKGPRGLTIGERHEVFQVDYEAKLVRALDYATGVQTGTTVQPAGTEEFLSRVVVESGRLFASSPGFGIIAFDSQTLHELRRVKVDDPGEHWLLNGICADSRGDVHLLSMGGACVHVFDRDLNALGTWNCSPGSSLLCAVQPGVILTSAVTDHATTIDAYSVAESSDHPTKLPISAEFGHRIADFCAADGRLYLATEEEGVFVFRLPNQPDLADSWSCEDWIEPRAVLSRPGKVGLTHIAVDAGNNRLYLAYESPERVVVAVETRPRRQLALDPKTPPPRLTIRESPKK